MSLELQLKRKVFIYKSRSTVWHMILLPKGVSKDLKQIFEGMTGGFGSLPVEVTIGKTTWKTSIFPENKEGAFLLLLKAEVRKKESIKAGDMVSFLLRVLI